MAKKRPTGDDAREPKRPNRGGVSLHIYIDPTIEDALQRYLDESELRVSKTAVCEAAIREFLRSKGFWPPATPKQGEDA